jgi:hypothetical protein
MSVRRAWKEVSRGTGRKRYPDRTRFLPDPAKRDAKGTGWLGPPFGTFALERHGGLGDAAILQKNGRWVVAVSCELLAQSAMNASGCLSLPVTPPGLSPARK